MEIIMKEAPVTRVRRVTITEEAEAVYKALKDNVGKRYALRGEDRTAVRETLRAVKFLANKDGYVLRTVLMPDKGGYYARITGRKG